MQGCFLLDSICTNQNVYNYNGTDTLFIGDVIINNDLYNLEGETYNLTSGNSI